MEIAAPAPAAAAPVAAMAPAPAPVPAAPVPVPIGLDPQAPAVERADAKETRAERQDGNAAVAPKPNVAEPGGGRAAAEDPPAGKAAPGGHDAHLQDALQQPSTAAQAPPASAHPLGPTGAQAPVPPAAKQSWIPAGVWYAQETEMLLQLVAAEGPNDWAGKAKRLGTGRTAKAVSTRWLRATGRIKDRRPSSVANKGLPGAPRRVALGAKPAPRPRPAAQQSSPDEPAGDNITQLARPARARVPTRKVVENASSATQRTAFPHSTQTAPRTVY